MHLTFVSVIQYLITLLKFEELEFGKLILYYKIKQEWTQNIDQMTKTAQVLPHYNLRKSLKQLALEHSKKKLIQIKINVMNLIIKLK